MSPLIENLTAGETARGKAAKEIYMKQTKVFLRQDVRGTAGLAAGLTALMLAAVMIAGCDTPTGSGGGGDGGGGGGEQTPINLASVNSIQEEIDNKTTVTKNSAASNTGKLVGAAYDTTSGNYKLLYKIGRINDLFSHYVTNGIPGGKGYGLSYTTSKETVTSQSLNTTIAASVTTGGEYGVDKVVVAKVFYETTVEVAVSATTTIEQAISTGSTYSYSFEYLDSDKLYAFAMFSSMDFYQIFSYNPNTHVATPINENGKPLVYYDILKTFSYQIYEYVPEDEIVFKTLEAWDSFTPAFSTADTALIEASKTPVSPPSGTSSSVYVYDGDSIKIEATKGQRHTVNRPVGLDITTLKNLLYKNIKITMSVQIRGHDGGDGRQIWLDINNTRKWGIENLNVPANSKWERREFTHTMAISEFNNSSTFRFWFDTKHDIWDFNDAIWYFNEATVTFTAVFPAVKIESPHFVHFSAVT